MSQRPSEYDQGFTEGWERGNAGRDDLAANVAALADEYRTPGACTCERGSIPNKTGWGGSATTTWHDDCPTHATDYRLRALLGGDTTALDARLADAWDEGHTAFGYDVANGTDTPNPYRARAGGTP